MPIEYSEWNEPRLFTFPRNLRWIQWCLVVVGIIVYFLAAVRNLWVIAFLAAACIALTLLSLVLEVEKAWKDRDYERLMKSVNAPNCMAAHIKVMQNGVVTGEDDGALWLKAGHLHFKGFATNFQIPTSLVSWNQERSIICTEEPGKWVDAGNSVGLDIQAPEGMYRVNLGTSSSEHMRGIYGWKPKDVLTNWLRLPSRNDEATLPPRTIRRRSFVKPRDIAAEWLGLALMAVYFFLELGDIGNPPGKLRLMTPAVLALWFLFRALCLQKKRKLQQEVWHRQSASVDFERALG